MTKKIKRRIIWGIGIGLTLLVAYRTLLPSSIEVTDILPAAGFEQEISLQDEDALRAAENNYTISVSGTKVTFNNLKEFSLKDESGQQIPLKELDNIADLDKKLRRTFTFSGKPNTTYSLAFKAHKDNDLIANPETSFKTPSTSNLLKNNLEQTEKALIKELTAQAKETLLEELTDDNSSESVWFNMSPYYLPSQKEKEAVVDAYWETFLIDTNYQLVLTKAEIDTYTFNFTYHWSTPNMEDLNRRINDRENDLKTELGNDYKKMFQTIVKELPDLIKKTPRLPQEEKEEWSNLSTSRSNDNNDKVNFKDPLHLPDEMFEPLKHLYP